LGTTEVAQEEQDKPRRRLMSGLIYLIGLIVVVMAILSFLGLH
jgi:hypothetical protein